MKRLLIPLIAVFAFVGCVLGSDKCTIKFTDGTVKTVYHVEKSDGIISYYTSKDDATNSKNKVTVPLTSIKEITDIKDE